MDSEQSGSRYPHTRAQLSAIARHYKLVENYDSDAETDEYTRAPAGLVNAVVALLADEKEEELKTLLRMTFGMDEDSMEQNVLDLMHNHRDDVAGVPFLFLTPTRRPISRPSSRASNHSTRLRPDTPSSAPASPLMHVFRRPHTPATSPLAPTTSYSPSSSPVIGHASVQYTASLPASPLSSPRLLNAKANEFRPITRPLSAAATTPGSFIKRTETPPPDMWAHNSPRATSNLAIAAPLIADHHASSGLRSSHGPRDEEDDLADDPFNSNPIPSFNSITLSEYDQYDSWPPADADHQPFPIMYGSGAYDYLGDPDDPSAAALTDGMTPFDVLSSIFGSTLAPSELEDALSSNAYDFDRAMQWLIDRSLPPVPSQSPPGGVRMQHMGARVTVVGRDGRVVPGGRGGYQATSPTKPPPRYVNGRPVPSGNRVCRYFVAGECLRADCRFSHDLERALCRFWLRGTCAKNEACEFLHHLPKDVDVNSLNAVLTRANVIPGVGPLGGHAMQQQQQQQPEEFPALGYDPHARANGSKKYTGYVDPGRTRFANAVKKAAPPTAETEGAPNGRKVNSLSSVVAPRPSPRLKLRPPLLLPTLPTGESVNSLYMVYRSRAIQLGGARNACLSRAADAWRRGDGAAAKRFSREGHELNAKMSAEMAEAAKKLVRERSKLAEGAVRNRDASWSDDPGDRSSRGKSVGGGLGVCLGVASASGDSKALSGEERTEAMLDLHGLHANEATEVLEQFLLALEREHFYGLAYAIVGEEKHTGTQDAARGASRARLAAGVREWLHRWGYPWSERDGIICIDPLTHASE